MKVNLYSLSEGARAARGLTVVVDVFRAFTCAPLFFSFGAERLILVGTAEEAFELKAGDNSLFLVGESHGIPIEGFDLGNSPSHILRLGSDFFAGKTVVQRTSSGVQGVLIALENADEVLLGSYSLAKATARYIKTRSPEQVSIVAMGWDLTEEAPEDEWCGRYIAHLLGVGQYDHNHALAEIIFHNATQRFLRGEAAHFPVEDPVLCLQRDVYDFALKACGDNGLVTVQKIPT
jgi:2-phosphosulfolactate phosphatase